MLHPKKQKQAPSTITGMPNTNTEQANSITKAALRENQPHKPVHTPTRQTTTEATGYLIMHDKIKKSMIAAQEQQITNEPGQDSKSNRAAPFRPPDTLSEMTTTASKIQSSSPQDEGV